MNSIDDYDYDDDDNGRLIPVALSMINENINHHYQKLTKNCKRPKNS